MDSVVHAEADLESRKHIDRCFTMAENALRKGGSP